MIPILRFSDAADRRRVESFLKKLRLDPRDIALRSAADATAVQQILNDVAQRGDDAIVETARRFDDAGFTAQQIRILPDEMKAAASRVSDELMSALRRSISQVREYQQHVMPRQPASLRRTGVELGMKFAPLDSAGLYFPGGKASYPSTLIMLAVPAQVAGVPKIVVCSPPSKFGRSDLVLAACHELGLTEVFRAGGAAAIAAMAFGTATIPAVDKIVGPGNRFVQLAKRSLAGCVGIDGFLGPSEILTLADDTGRADFIAADLLAQAEHDPGSCFLVTTSRKLADEVLQEIQRQLKWLERIEPLKKSLANESAIILVESEDEMFELANRFGAEHVNIQMADEANALDRLRHAGAVFIGPYSPVAAGDYIAGPSHCLPTNTTARFSSGISVYEFLKRMSIERYDEAGLAADADAIIALAKAEGLDAHAASVRAREKR